MAISDNYGMFLNAFFIDEELVFYYLIRQFKELKLDCLGNLTIGLLEVDCHLMLIALLNDIFSCIFTKSGEI